MKNLILIVVIALAGPGAFAQGKSNHNKGGHGGGNKSQGSTIQNNKGNPGVSKNQGNNKHGGGFNVVIVDDKGKGNGHHGNEHGEHHGNNGHSNNGHGKTNTHNNGRPPGMSGHDYGQMTAERNRNKHKVPKTQGLALKEISIVHKRIGVLVNTNVNKIKLLKEVLERRRRLGTISDIEYKRHKNSINLLEARHKTIQKRLKPF